MDIKQAAPPLRDGNAGNEHRSNTQVARHRGLGQFCEIHSNHTQVMLGLDCSKVPLFACCLIRQRRKWGRTSNWQYILSKQTSGRRWSLATQRQPSATHAANLTVDSVIRHTIVRHTLAYRILGADSPIVVLAGVNPSIRHSLLYGIAHLDSRGVCRKAELTVLLIPGPLAFPLCTLVQLLPVTSAIRKMQPCNYDRRPSGYSNV